MIPARPASAFIAPLAASAAALLASTVSQGQALSPPQYQGVSTLTVLASGAQTALYYSSGAGVRYTNGYSPSGSSTTPTSDAISESQGEASASALYSADAGTLRIAGAVSVSAVGSAGSPGHLAEATALSNFEDAFMVEGRSPDTIGIATLRFTMALDGSLSTTDSVPGAGFDSASIHAGMNVQNGPPTMQCSPACNVSYDGVSGTSGSGITGSPVASVEVTAPYGSTMTLYGFLSAADSVDTFGNVAYAADSDYSHTMNIFADVLTPGVTLIFASGHDYTSPAAIPEPPPAMLLALGLAALGALAARRPDRRPATARVDAKI